LIFNALDRFCPASEDAPKNTISQAAVQRSQGLKLG
jgi:hypothetical protein